MRLSGWKAGEPFTISGSYVVNPEPHRHPGVLLSDVREGAEGLTVDVGFLESCDDPSCPAFGAPVYTPEGTRR